MAPYQFSQLFHKYITGVATPEEVDQLMEWINQAEYDPRLKSLLEEAWIKYSDEVQVFSEEESAAILGKVLHPESQSRAPVRPMFYKIIGWSAAAAVVLTLGLLWIFNSHSSMQGKPVAVNTNNGSPKDINAGTNKAVLMIGEGAVVMLDSASNGTLDKSASGQIIKQDSFLSYRQVQLASNTPRYDKIVTPLRGTYQIELSDGTKVWLNAGSSLRFPVPFTGDTRTVEITGEAYFEVAPNAGKHFLVKVIKDEDREPISVLALGTSFNVNAYNDEHSMRTTLLSGLVKVMSSGKEMLMKPGQQIAVTENEQMKLRDADTDRVVAWKNGMFDFEEDHLRDILRQLSRWYGVQVEGQIPDKYLTGAIRRSANLSEVLKMLEKATRGVDFSIHQNSIRVTRTSE